VDTTPAKLNLSGIKPEAFTQVVQEALETYYVRPLGWMGDASVLGKSFETERKAKPDESIHTSELVWDIARRAKLNPEGMKAWVETNGAFAQEVQALKDRVAQLAGLSAAKDNKKLFNQVEEAYKQVPRHNQEHVHAVALQNGNVGVALPFFYDFEEASQRFPTLISKANKQTSAPDALSQKMEQEIYDAFGARDQLTTVDTVKADKDAYATLGKLSSGRNIVVVPMFDKSNNDLILVTRTPVAYVNTEDTKVKKAQEEAQKKGTPFAYYQLALGVKSLTEGLIRCITRDGYITDGRLAKSPSEISKDKAGFFLAYYKYVDLGIPVDRSVSMER
jgi:hypothetical protein